MSFRIENSVLVVLPCLILFSGQCNFIPSFFNPDGMKKLLSLFLIFFVFLNGNSQSLKYVHFSNGADIYSLSYITDQKIIIKISLDGKILEYGIDQEAGRYYSQPGKLQPYMGRIEYYTNQFDSILNGKLKSIGITTITYYGSFENKSLVGKIKSIGNMQMDYFNEFENDGLRGKLRSAGQNRFDYYGSFENDAYKGKIKTLGTNQITYYSTFDDKYVQSKLKSIGSFNYVWYTSFETTRFRAGLKSGNTQQLIDGVLYIIW